MDYFLADPALFDLPSSVDAEERARIDGFLELLEASGIGPLIAGTSRSPGPSGGRPCVDRCRLFAAVLYAFAFSGGTLRGVEDLLRYDLRFSHIMGGLSADHSTVGRLIRDVVAPNARRIFALVTREALRRMGADTSVAYVDGTKIEANANKYKFVWRPTAYHRRASATANAIIEREGLVEGYRPEEEIRSSTLALALSAASDRGSPEPVRRALESILGKVLEYEERERACGEGRRSYYKTDRDATAMALKADYYSGLGSNMHAAYNVQVAVCGGLACGYLVSSDRSDIRLLRGAVESCAETLGRYPESVCADAGYGSMENYLWLREAGIRSFVKHQSWSGNASGRAPDCLRPSGAGFRCLGGRAAEETAVPGRHPKKAGGRFYLVRGCLSCAFMPYCKRRAPRQDEDFRVFEVSPEYEALKAESEANLLSVEGIAARVNRGIQAEGVFAELKQNMGFSRLRRRGMGPVSAEVMLVLLGTTVRRYRQFLATGRAQRPWAPPEGTLPQEFKKPSARKLSKRGAREREKAARKK